MKLTITFLSLLFISINSYSQVDTTKVAFVSYWSKGDSYDFQVTKIKQQWKGESLTKNDSSSYVVNFQVVDSTATSYTIKWSYKTSLIESYKIPQKVIDKFSKYEVTEVIYETTEVGEFVGIQNWKELSEMMKGLFSDLIEIQTEEGNSDSETLKTSLQPLMSVYDSKEGIEQLVFKELQYFHFPFGVEYSTEEPIFYEEQLPNMFGGKPIRGDAKLYFEHVDFDKSFCILIQEMKLNSDDTRNVIVDLFKRMNFDNKQIDKAMKTAKLDIRDNNKYEYYYYPGIPVRIETIRESIVDIDKEKARGIEKTRIELLE